MDTKELKELNQGELIKEYLALQAEYDSLDESYHNIRAQLMEAYKLMDKHNVLGVKDNDANNDGRDTTNTEDTV